MANSNRTACATTARTASQTVHRGPVGPAMRARLVRRDAVIAMGEPCRQACVRERTAPPDRREASGLVRVLAVERLGPAALGRAGGRVLDRLPVVAVVVGLALGGAGVARDRVGAVVLAGGRDAVALRGRGGLGRGGGLGERDRPGERAGDGQETGLVHLTILTFSFPETHSG